MKEYIYLGRIERVHISRKIKKKYIYLGRVERVCNGSMEPGRLVDEFLFY